MHRKVITAIASLAIFIGIFAVRSRNLASNNFKTSNLLSVISNLLIPPAGAVQLRDRKTYFVQLPTLLDAETTINLTNATSATYYFEISLPQSMGEPLQKLEIFQAEGFETIDFISNDTIAYLQTGTSDRVSISNKTEIIQNQDRQKITVTFDPPISASSEFNRKLVVGVRPVRNPRYEGVYLYGVSAAPQGDRPNSQFLGYGRLHFYSSRY